MSSQQQASSTPENLRDLWQTPQFVFDYFDEMFEFDFDLAANSSNAKCQGFFDIDDDSLSQRWYRVGNTLWLNPPYSNTGDWLEKARNEAKNGITIAVLCPLPNGENHYRDFVFGKAGEVIFINGRLSFELPQDDGTVKAINGNTRGSCLVIFNRIYEGQTLLSWVNRDDMRRKFVLKRKEQ